MTPDSDLDFLLIKRACNARDLARLGRNALPQGVPLDVIAATPDYLAEKRDSLSSLLRTAIEEGVTVFADRYRLPYRPNTAAARAHAAPAPEPPPLHARPYQPDEARSWLKHALYKLQVAEFFADRKPGEYMRTADTCGASRSAVESALKALIVAHGVRPRKYQKPPDLACEAGAAGEMLPQLEPHALEAIGRHYNGRIYPGYPEPEVAEAEQALGLATILVRHAVERVPVILNERRPPAHDAGPTNPQR